jgi:hypothetical protein
MASAGALGVLRTKGEAAMFPVMLPPPLLALLAAFRPCFTTPSYQVFP